MHKISDGLLEIHLPEQVDSLIPDESELTDQILDFDLADLPLTMLEIHFYSFF